MTDEETLLVQGLRFQKLLKTLNHNGKTLAETLVVSQPLISQVISGKRGITKFLVEKLTARYPDVNINWLYTGNGEMFFSVETPITMVNEYMDMYNVSKKITIDELSGVLDSMQQEIADLRKRITELEKNKLA
jgi:antitoxin component HigA of HigAB toxin-antitoxin module